jgi:hypothetical protein
MPPTLKYRNCEVSQCVVLGRETIDIPVWTRGANAPIMMTAAGATIAAIVALVMGVNLLTRQVRLMLNGQALSLITPQWNRMVTGKPLQHFQCTSF